MIDNYQSGGLVADHFLDEFPEQVDRKVSRTAQAGQNDLPEGTVVVSADSHWLEGDIWIDRFPEELRSSAPRMQFIDGGWELTFGDKQTGMFPRDAAQDACQRFECIPGFTSVEERLKDLDIEGVRKELLFPQRLLGLAAAGEIAMREHVFRGWNEYISEICARAADRLYFVAIPNYWDPAEAKASLEEVKALGARAVMVPLNPRNDVDGLPIALNNPKMDAFYAAVAESGLPLCFHIGENIPTNLPGAAATYIVTGFQGFRPTWSALTFSGVFDRFPDLRVCFVEGGMHWVPSMLYDADLVVNSFPTMIDVPLKHKPSYYWHNNCYAVFMTDPVGLQLIDRIGTGRVMWSSDYPHPEGTFGYTRSAMQAVVDAVPAADARKILGGTALDVFNMR